jgi:3-methylcrotonyl-CoA carboxylase alpha subunit
VTPCAILIANRGEIAVRIIRACSDLGMQSIALHTYAECDSLFVHLADRAICVDVTSDLSVYLDGALIIKTAIDAGARAIHPGYGFLAESADFAQQCEDNGLIFVGPEARIIDLMGNKETARKVAAQSGVSIVPGFDDSSDVSVLLEQADRLGYPLMIKACAGGGGKGMRKVSGSNDFVRTLYTVRQEANAAFANDSVIVERCLSACRHVEVQVLADKHGHCIHLFDRDCSWQRRHQKLIEEAPAKNIPQHIREAMFTQALMLCKHIGYCNAGTVEFLYDAQDQVFYFLEMNTRLQVEHAVTEMITGIDIVQWQLRIALGDILDLAQVDVTSSGHSIEVRVLAEDPYSGFRPDIGGIEYLQWPQGDKIRVDSGVQAKDHVGMQYDSMLAKLIVHEGDRQGAIQSLHAAINNTRLIGVANTLKAQQQLLLSTEFQNLTHTTDLLDNGFCFAEPKDVLAIVTELALTRFLLLLKGKDNSIWTTLAGWRITDTIKGARHWLYFEKHGEHYSVCIQQQNKTLSCSVNDVETLVVQSASFDNYVLRYYVSEESCECFIYHHQSSFWHSECSEIGFTSLAQPAERSSIGWGQGDDALAIVAPMPGRVVELLVGVGDQVEEGEAVCVIEAMKQFLTLTAPSTATVKSLRCEIGQSVNQHILLLELEERNE